MAFKLTLALSLTMYAVSMAAVLPKRVVGGDTAELGEFPFIVSVLYRGGHSCGGSLLDSTTVLTASHCIMNLTGPYPAHVFQVRAGSLDRDSGGRVVNVSKAIMHPGYNTTNFDNDIAVMKLSEPIQEHYPSISYMRNMPDEGSDPSPNSTVTVAGWGITGNGQLAEHLQRVEMPIVSREACQKSYDKAKFPFPITENKVCAGSEGKTGCEADSGGPLVKKDTGELIGVVSHGSDMKCDAPGSFGAYVRVANYHSFIKENM
ncbi:hypothetical protein HIM_06703 [Hirsutella minnesotensis 3608]|uniref:Peptidase S1 domain-containing protein n=1 Tax=Hirsutella minnesotensis 3608 TaxID=1043627 RepID=A0A0F7ZNI5_9HYPO|nr:hypothetical protein HIM_06703 [Hirsutella minnesotensis 3608]